MQTGVEGPGDEIDNERQRERRGREEIGQLATDWMMTSTLEAYEATRDSYYLEAARDVAQALVKGQYCSGGWDYLIEFDPQKRVQFPYRVDGRCGTGTTTGTARPTTLDDNVTQAAARLLMRVDRALDFRDAPIHEAALFSLDSLIRRHGYDLSYSDASVITHYAVLVSAPGLAEIEREYREIEKADPATLRRPDRLRGLSPSCVAFPCF